MRSSRAWRFPPARRNPTLSATSCIRSTSPTTRASRWPPPVWNVGHGTPVHGHETWGVVGILSGQEHELSYDKPPASGEPLTRNGEHIWGRDEVTACCTTDDDVHQVRCEGDESVVGIYGDNIGTLERRSYDPESRAVSWFVSRWAEFEST